MFLFLTLKISKELVVIKIEEILKYFPANLYNVLQNVIHQNEELEKKLVEIRIRCNKPIILKIRRSDIPIDYIVEQTEILQTLEKLCENSIYAYKKQLCEGFLTVKGGHRVGITGTVVSEDNEIINIKYISSLNFRIARQILGCSNNVIDKIIDLENKTIFNTLIVSPPGKGKTTLLRDIIRVISNGIPEIEFSGQTCGVVDERGEIAASYKGVPQNDIGIRTDIIENVNKAKGMKILIRSMAPQVIACDEIGSKEDVQAIKEAMISGVKGIFTIHGKDMNDIKRNKEINELIENKQIEKIIFL